MESFGATTIIGKIILEGGHVVIVDGSGSGVVVGGSSAVVGANDAPLTVFKTNHYEYDHIGYTYFAPSSECSACKCQDCKVKHDVLINTINALTSYVKELTSKRVDGAAPPLTRGRGYDPGYGENFVGSAATLMGPATLDLD
ncbi:hypothetical protein FXO37_25363 [Capsicum annuum]|nr:hypothetical protein FXO37_25363 [Capsicum annuum]